MQIDGVVSSQKTNQNTLSTDASQNTINYNQFLQLLIAQLKNQDPTKPTDSTQFVSQLASFSGVEQQIKTNTRLDSLLSETALSQAASLVGRTVTSADATVTGVVAAVDVKPTGLTATLTSGATIQLGTGVKIS